MDVSGQSAPRVSTRGKRAWKRLLVVAMVVGGMLATGAGLCAGVFYYKLAAVKSSAPYCQALEQVRNDRQVIERLGEPIDDVTWMPGGIVEEEQGMANLHFTVAGPKGSAQVGTQSRRVDGAWGLLTLDVIFDDGQRTSVAVDSGDEAGGGEAPRWTPGM